MNCKCIFTLCALFALQDLALADPAINRDTRDVTQNIKDTIQKLKDLVHTTIEDAIKQLRDSLNDIKDIATQIIKKTTDQMKDIASGTLDQINNLRDKANELGIDVKDCIGNSEEQIVNLPSLMVDELVECITRKLKEAEQIVTDTINDVTSTISVITGIEEAFKKCQSNGSSIACLLKVLGEATTQLVKLPIKIGGHVLKAKKFIITVKADLAICASSKIAKLTMEVGKIGVEVTKCTADKMKNQIPKTIQALKDLVDTTIKDAVKQLHDSLNGIKDFATQIITKTTDEINSIASGTLDEIKKLKDKATELGIDVKDCVGNSEEQIMNLPSLMVKELVECITKKVKEAEQIVTDTINDVTSTISVITGIEEEFKKCQSDGSSITCLQKVLSDATIQLAKLPLKIAGQVLKAKKFMITVKADLAICASSKIAKLTMEVGKIGVEVTKCTADKMKNQIPKTIQALKDLVDTTIKDAVKQLNDSLNAIKDFATQIIKKTTDEMNSIASGTLDEIKKLKDKATELGIDVKDCVGNSEEQIMNLPSLMGKELVECITKKVKEAEQIVTDTISDVTSTISVITGIEEEYKKCQSNGSSITCLQKVLGDATLQLTKLPLKIAGQVLKAKKFMITVKADLAICASSKIAKLTMEVGKIGGDVTKCIADKIQNHDEKDLIG